MSLVKMVLVGLPPFFHIFIVGGEDSLTIGQLRIMRLEHYGNGRENKGVVETAKWAILVLDRAK